MQCELDPYEIPKSMGIFRLLESPKDITTATVAQRIMANHEAYVVISLTQPFFFLPFLLSQYLSNLQILLIWLIGYSNI